MTMKAHKGFIPKFYLDQRKNIIRGKVLNVRDTITFHGRTVAEAWKSFRNSVDDYLAFCEELGVEPEKPFSGKLLVRITPEMHRNLSIRAQQQGLSINKFVKHELERALGSNRLQTGIMDDFGATKSRARKKAVRSQKPKANVESVAE